MHIKDNIQEEEEEEEKEDEEISENASIKDLGVEKTPKPDDRICILPIIGQIEGHNILPPQNKTTKYEHVIPQLIAAETNNVTEGILIILNTVGGDVEAGLAISELIRSVSKPTVSLVIGGGHSIGVPLATAADYSFISPSATMIIHPIRMNGLIIGASQTFEYFNKMQERILEFISQTSNISKETLNQLMSKTDSLLNDMGTILIGPEAVEMGLINEVGGLKDALKKLNQMIDHR